MSPCPYPSAIPSTLSVAQSLGKQHRHAFQRITLHDSPKTREVDEIVSRTYLDSSLINHSRWQLIADHNEWPNRTYTMILCFLLELVGTLSVLPIFILDYIQIYLYIFNTEDNIAILGRNIWDTRDRVNVTTTVLEGLVNRVSYSWSDNALIVSSVFPRRSWGTVCLVCRNGWRGDNGGGGEKCRRRANHFRSSVLSNHGPPSREASERCVLDRGFSRLSARSMQQWKLDESRGSSKDLASFGRDHANGRSNLIQRTMDTSNRGKLFCELTRLGYVRLNSLGAWNSKSFKNKGILQ